MVANRANGYLGKLYSKYGRMDGSIMAGTTTYLGITYPTSTDYVKDGASAMQTIATGFDTAVAIPTYNAQTGTTYTFALSDVGKTVTASNASSSTYTIPPQASVVWPTGATLNIVNLGAGVVTIAAGAGVTVTNSSQTLSQYQSAALVRTASNAWTVVPFVGGVATLADSAISGTTGSPTTATYTSGGINYKTYRWTGTGSMTLTKPGIVDVFIVGGGGGTGNYASNGGGGGGGAILTQSVYLSDGTCNVIIGAGGSKPNNYALLGGPGSASAIGVGTNIWTYVALGGGGGGTEISTPSTAGRNGISGGSGGGGAGGSSGGGSGGTAMLTGMGNSGGGAGTSTGSGGGGGYSAAGTAGSGTTSGAGGNGLTSTFFDGSTGVGYAGGGGGTGGTAGASGTGGGGTVNTGGGGTNVAGGSGLVMIRVRA